MGRAEGAEREAGGRAAGGGGGGRGAARRPRVVELGCQTGARGALQRLQLRDWEPKPRAAQGQGAPGPAPRSLSTRRGLLPSMRHFPFDASPPCATHGSGHPHPAIQSPRACMNCCRASMFMPGRPPGNPAPGAAILVLAGCWEGPREGVACAAKRHRYAGHARASKREKRVEASRIRWPAAPSRHVGQAAVTRGPRACLIPGAPNCC